mgnify:CR=1 FL=1
MTKTLLGSLREYKKGSILTILLSVLEAAFEIQIGRASCRERV